MWFQSGGRSAQHKNKRRKTLGCESLEDRRLLTADFLPGDAQIAPAVNEQQFVAIEPGGTGFLSVWTDQRPVLSGFVNTTNPISGSGSTHCGDDRYWAFHLPGSCRINVRWLPPRFSSR
jgi:hypothetical protein